MAVTTKRKKAIKSRAPIIESGRIQNNSLSCDRYKNRHFFYPQMCFFFCFESCEDAILHIANDNSHKRLKEADKYNTKASQEKKLSVTPNMP